MLGFILAVISSLFYSFYVVPRKLSKLSPLAFSFLMSCGFFISTIALYLAKPLLNFQEQPSVYLLWSVVAGAIWAASFVTFIKAIDTIGLSRSNQWKNFQGPIAAVLGLVILAEYEATRPIFVLLAGLAIFFSAMCLTIADDKQQSHLNKKGIYLATLAALGFGTVAIIQKYVTTHVGVYTQQVVWSFSIMVSIVIYAWAKGVRLPKVSLVQTDVRLGLVAGLLYMGASLFQLLSYKHLPASIAFTVIQLNTVGTIGIGVLYFKEIPFKKHHLRLTLGLILAVIGILALAISKK